MRGTGHQRDTGPAPPWRVLAVFGPTGIGKTAVALALADRLRERGSTPVAVSADALQLYAGLGVLTGAATADQRNRLEHRLVGVLPVNQTFSAGAYAQRAHEAIDGLLHEGATPVVVGGTGLYLRAAPVSTPSPAYSCSASADTATGVRPRSHRRSASASATAVLPIPVGPKTARTRHGGAGPVSR